MTGTTPTGRAGVTEPAEVTAPAAVTALSEVTAPAGRRMVRAVSRIAATIPAVAKKAMMSTSPCW